MHDWFNEDKAQGRHPCLGGIASTLVNAHTFTVGTRLSLAKHDGLRLLAMANGVNVSDLLRSLVDAALDGTTPTLAAPVAPAPAAPVVDLSGLTAAIDAMRHEMADLRSAVAELRCPAPAAAPLTLNIPQLDGLNALASRHAAVAAAADTRTLRQRIQTALFDYADAHNRRHPKWLCRLTFRGDVAVIWHRKLNADALARTLADDTGCSVDDVHRFVVVDHHNNGGDASLTALLPVAHAELLPPSGG